LNRILGTVTSPRTIYLAPGLYSPSATGEHFPLDGRHHVTVSGASEQETILSAEDSSGMFYVFYVEDFNMENMTIEGGTAEKPEQIQIIYSGTSLKDITIKDNQSSAIYIWNSDVSITDVVISDNEGTGINHGVNLTEYYLNLKNVTLRNNGTGIALSDGINVTFDPVERCNIYNNKTDLRISTAIYNKWPITVYVDTFSVFYPSDYHTYPVAGFNIDILHALEEQVAADLYVNPDGSDENSGLSEDEPLKTIEKAIRKIISDSLHIRNVFLAAGVYGPSTTGELFPVRGRSYVTLIGEDPGTTIMDGSNSGSILGALRNRDIIIENIWMRNGASNINITACENISFHRVAITDHMRQGVTWGPALKIDSSNDVNLINFTITGNKAYNYYGEPTPGTALWSNASRVNVINSILWYNGNEPIQLRYLTNPYGGSISNLAMSYSNNEFGDSCLYPYSQGNFFWLSGNLDTNPLFRDTTYNDYRLLSNSPCIDGGIQDTMIVYNDGLDTIFIPPMTYLGSAPDMGAFEFEPADQIDEDTPLPRKYALHQNYPNPFNPVTTIAFELQKACRVELQIYNSIGQRVLKLVNSNLSAGRYIVSFDGSGLASGVYFYRIQADQFNAVKKMLLIR
jgi:hypothetical protein